MVISPGQWKRWPTRHAPADFRLTSHATRSRRRSRRCPDSGRTQRRLSVLSDFPCPSASTWARKSRGRSQGSLRRAPRQSRGRAYRSRRTKSRALDVAIFELIAASARSCAESLRAPAAARCCGRAFQLLADRGGLLGQVPCAISVKAARRRPYGEIARLRGPRRRAAQVNRRARSSRALSCMRAGISSERSSRRKSVTASTPDIWRSSRASYGSIYASQLPFARSRTRPI
jgi:hypothetical protein